MKRFLQEGEKVTAILYYLRYHTIILRHWNFFSTNQCVMVEAFFGQQTFLGQQYWLGLHISSSGISECVHGSHCIRLPPFSLTQWHRHLFLLHLKKWTTRKMKSSVCWKENRNMWHYRWTKKNIWIMTSGQLLDTVRILRQFSCVLEGAECPVWAYETYTGKNDFFAQQLAFCCHKFICRQTKLILSTSLLSISTWQSYFQAPVYLC